MRSTFVLSQVGVLLFAQDPSSATQGWVALIVQTGAIGILGYHLLFGLPKLIEQMTVAQKESTQFLVGVFERALSSSQNGFSERSGAIVSELKQQTPALVMLAKKMEQWPSDAGRLCRVHEVLTEFGFSEKTIARLIERREKAMRDRSKATDPEIEEYNRPPPRK